MPAPRRTLHAPRRLYWIVPCCAYLWAVWFAPRVEGPDLFPVPDAQEYAILATRLAQFDAPLIPVGPGLFPSRYSLAYPLLLVPVAWIAGLQSWSYWWSSIVFGLLAVVLMARVGRWLLGSRWTAGLAALFFALHPAVVHWSTTLMSEMAVMTVFFGMLAAARPWLTRIPGQSGIVRAICLGLLLGWLTLAKAPFVYWVVAVTLLVFWRQLQANRLAPAIALATSGLCVAAGDLLYRRWAFGAWGLNGYEYWLPQIYANFSTVFNFKYAANPYDLLAAGGTAEQYGRMLLGRTHHFYGWHFALVASLGLVALCWPWRRGRPTWSILALLAGWAMMGLLFLMSYFFVSDRFPLLWIPLIDWLAAWGLMRLPYAAPLRRGTMRRLRAVRCAQGLCLLAAVVLVRGEIARIRGLYHRSDWHTIAPRGFIIREMLEKVPRDAWLFTNWMLPTIQLWREGGPTAALYLHLLDSRFWNGHAWTIQAFGLQPKTSVETHDADQPDRELGRPFDAPTLINEGDWNLSAKARRKIFAQPLYMLVVDHTGPGHTVHPTQVFPATAEHLENLIFPLLRTELNLQTIQHEGDVTLYRATVRETQGGMKQTHPTPAIASGDKP